MQLLNKNTDYAIRSLMYLAKNTGSYINSREIATNVDIPLHFVRRILQDLKQHTYLDSKEGISGGVKLIKAPKDIPLSEVLELFQGEMQLSACMFRKKLCPERSRCVLRGRILSIEEKLVDEFRNVTIQTLLNDMETMNETSNN